MTELFLFGTLWFWALVALEVVLLFTFVANEKGTQALFSVLAFLGLIHFCGDINVFAFVRHNWQWILGGFATYFVVGTCWMLGRWRLLNEDELQRIMAYVNDVWPQPRNDTNREEAKRYIARCTPCVYSNKNKLVDWILFWPISMLIYFCHDLVLKIANMIYNRMVTRLQKITDRVFSRIPADLK